MVSSALDRSRPPRKNSGWGVSWTTSELSASTPTSGRLQPRTRGNGAERQNKGRTISWQNGSLQKKTKVVLRHAVVCANVTGRTKERIAQSKRARGRSLALVDYPQVARTCALRALVCRYHDVFLWCYLCFILLRFRLYAFVEAAALRSIVLRYAGAPIATRVSFSFSGDFAFSEYFLYHFRSLVVWRVYVVRSFLPNDVFLPCDHGLDF